MVAKYSAYSTLSESMGKPHYSNQDFSHLPMGDGGVDIDCRQHQLGQIK